MKQEHYGQSVGCDQHKRYSVFATADANGKTDSFVRYEHREREQLEMYLESLGEGTPVAVESSGHWYWMLDLMEECGVRPFLVNAHKAKLMMGQINKTDKLDAKGLARLLHNGTLPAVWVPPKELRDKRELLRYRMFLSSERTKVKNRVHATLNKYAIWIDEVTDIFGKRGRELLKERLVELPHETRHCVREEMGLIDKLTQQIEKIEKRIQRLIKKTPSMELLQTSPGVGTILSAVISVEIGDVNRFGRAENLASYAGVTPRVHQSGAKRYHGPIRRDANRYLKWAFIEAATAIIRKKRNWPNKHSVKLYERVRHRRGAGKAIVAVARHLAEASYWILKKGEPYREPKNKSVSSTHE